MGARPINSFNETGTFETAASFPGLPSETNARGPAETPSPKAKIRVLVVDDHPFVRHGVFLLINRQRDLVCCDCEVDSAAAVIPAVQAHKPGLVLLDLNLKDGSALPLIPRLKSEFPSLIILVLSQFEEQLCAEQALHAGAAGYVLKEEATDEILAAIRAVLHEEIYLSRKMASAFLNRIVGSEGLTPAALVEHLTAPELEVFQLLAMGLSTYEIMGQMKIGARSVETHRRHLREKLKLSNNAALTDYAIRCRHCFDQKCGDPDATLLHCALQWEQWEQGHLPGNSKSH